ncbi:MAG: ABC transporter ATP-binding protein [Methanomassiliicoccaceae archaeon]|nr:ABC transporter ATP-binding protein [Methanomassiliicoccaceae archaeon]
MSEEQSEEQRPECVIQESTKVHSAASIQIRDLKKVFRRDEVETVALDDFSLDIRKGELIALVGPSGCGKTTILRLIAGLTEPTSGEILINGRPCTAPGADRGMVFQDFALFPWRSVRKNVEFGLEVAGVPKEERRERAERYINRTGLEKFIDARVHELSGGMKQRVGIARALVCHPDVILMDEPFGALDAQTRNIMQVQLLKILEKTDQTIVFVTHSVDEAVFLSDRIVVLTKRPARIKEIIDIPWQRPRDRACSEFTALRKRILTELEEENVMNN